MGHGKNTRSGKAAAGITHIARANLCLNPVDEVRQIGNRAGRYLLPEADVPHP